MLRTRLSRRIVPLVLVVGFAILVPVRSYAAVAGFESAWEHLLDLFWGKPLTGLFQAAGIDMDPMGGPAPSGAAAGGVTGLFANNGTSMDPNGRPEPSGITGGGGAGLLQDNGTEMNPNGQPVPRR